MIARTVCASSSRSTPATPRQTAAGVIPFPPSAACITSCSTCSTSASPDACRLAGPPRASETISPCSSASRHTVFVPPASIPSTCMVVDSMLPSSIPMRSAASRISLPRCAAALIAAALALLLPSSAVVRADEDVRALWVVRTSLTSPAAIKTMVSSAQAAGFNTLLVQIRGRADAYYADALEPRPAALVAQPAFDPLATTLTLAHDAGLQVHAWINVNLVSSANELPSAREHVIYRHPEWLMIPRALAVEMNAIDPRSPAYLGRLARYVRNQPELEGLYLSPATDAAAAYLASVVHDVVSRYAVDGVHFDYIRYPAGEFDYGRETLNAFRRSVVPDLSAADLRQYDQRAAVAPLTYTQAFPERWRTFRTTRMTALMERLHDVVKAARSGATVSAAVVPDASVAASQRFQEWRTWLDRGWLDVVCPMAYTTDSAVFTSQISTMRDGIAGRRIWAGIGAYRLSTDQIVENVQTARRLGAGGIVLFSYDSLTGPSRGPD